MVIHKKVLIGALVMGIYAGNMRCNDYYEAMKNAKLAAISEEKTKAFFTTVFTLFKAQKFITLEKFLTSFKELRSIDLNYQDENGYSALIYAARYSRLDILNFFLVHGADPNPKTKDKVSPLGCAVDGRVVNEEERYIKYLMAKYLLRAGANVNHANASGKTALHRASDSRMIELLLKFGADVTHVDKAGKQPIDYLDPSLPAEQAAYIKNLLEQSKLNRAKRNLTTRFFLFKEVFLPVPDLSVSQPEIYMYKSPRKLPLFGMSQKKLRMADRVDKKYYAVLNNKI